MLKSFRYGIHAILFLFFVFIILGSLFYRAEYNLYRYGDIPVFSTQDISGLALFAAGALAVLLLITAMGRGLERFRPSLVVPGILLGALAVNLGLVFLVPTKPTADMSFVNAIANMFLKGDYSVFNTHRYLYMHPQNTGISLFIYILYLIFPDSPMVVKIANVLFSLLTAFMIYLVHGQLKGKREEQGYGLLLLSCLFIPAILMNNLVYNDVVSTGLFVCSVYFAVKYTRSGKAVHGLLAGIFLSVGNYIRGIGIIFLIAFTLYMLLNQRKAKTFVLLAVAVLLFVMPSPAINKIIENRADPPEPIGSNAAPILMWVNIGLSADTYGFWDKGVSYLVYADAGWNKKISEARFKELIVQSLKNRGKRNLLIHYGKKTFWVWGEGTYQSELYGLEYHSFGGYLYETPVTRYLEDNLKFRDDLRQFTYAFNLLLYGLIAAGLLHSMRKGNFRGELLVILILGFIGFYIIWEIKSRYLFVCYPYLLLLGYGGLERAGDRIWPGEK